MGESYLEKQIYHCRPVPWSVEVESALQGVWARVCEVRSVQLPLPATAHGVLRSHTSFR